MQVLIPLVLLVITVIVAAKAAAIVRRDRVERQKTELADRQLYEDGVAAAKKARKRTIPGAEAFNVAGIENPVMWMAYRLSAIILLTIIAASSIGVWSGLLVVVAGAAIMACDYRHTKKKYLDLFDEQFARALPQIAASVSSSLTFERALRVSMLHMDDPLKEQFRQALAEAAFETPLYAALEHMAERVMNPHARTLAAAARIQGERGGNIAPALEMISIDVNGSLKAERELRTEIASTRMTKWIVAAAMPAIFAIVFFFDQSTAHFYMTDPLGWAVIGGSLVIEVVGLLVISKITKID